MLTISLLCSLISYFFSLFVFCMKRKHLLLMLLSLEFVVISLYFMLIVLLMGMSFETYFSMVFLTMAVCEGALGLSILVSLIRSHGNDYFNMFNVLW